MKYLIIILIVLSSCSGYKKITRTESEIKLLYEGPWASNFKNIIFTKILINMYGQAFYDCCLSKDASQTVNFEWINHDTAILNTAVEISNKFLKTINQGRIETKNVKLNFAIEYRNSIELDSLTGYYYRKYNVESLKNN